MTTPYDPKRELMEEQNLRKRLAVAHLEYMATRGGNEEVYQAYKRALKAYSDFVLRGISSGNEATE